MPGSLAKGTVIAVESCIPVIPSNDVERSLHLWADGLGFSIGSEMHKDDKLIYCTLRNDDMWFTLNQRAGTALKPNDCEGTRLYWAPKDIEQTRERLKGLRYVLVQPEMERGRSPLVSIPPFGRGFSRHRYDHQAIPQHGCVP
jgi:hypothetical protein